jgi:hypothetical protein
VSSLTASGLIRSQDWRESDGLAIKDKFLLAARPYGLTVQEISRVGDTCHGAHWNKSEECFSFTS